jgi:hypothetical protein
MPGAHGVSVHVRRFQCDTSEWEFAIATGDCELVALLFFRGERFGPEFRAANQADLQRAIARWLLLYTDKAGGLH